RVVFGPDALSVTSPLSRRTVRLGADTTVRLRTGIDGSVRKITLADGDSRLSLWGGLWGDDENFRRQLFTALVGRGVTGDLAPLLRPPDLAVNMRAVGSVMRGHGPR